MATGPQHKVRGLGSAKAGTEDWWYQRVTSVALLPLAAFVVVVVMSLIGADHATAVARLSHPIVAVGLIVTLVTVAWHMHIGMRVVLEDYVHQQPWKVIAVLANTFFSVAVAFFAVFAVLRISFGA